jgi:hypothetical protein
MKVLSLYRARYTFFVLAEKSPAIQKDYLDSRGNRWFVTYVEQRGEGWLVELQPHDLNIQLLPGVTLSRIFHSDEATLREKDLTELLRGVPGFVIARGTESGTVMRAVFLEKEPPPGRVPLTVGEMPVEVYVIPFPKEERAG